MKVENKTFWECRPKLREGIRLWVSVLKELRRKIKNKYRLKETATFMAGWLVAFAGITIPIMLVIHDGWAMVLLAEITLFLSFYIGYWLLKYWLILALHE